MATIATRYAPRNGCTNYNEIWALVITAVKLNNDEGVLQRVMTGRVSRRESLLQRV